MDLIVGHSTRAIFICRTMSNAILLHWSVIHYQVTLSDILGVTGKGFVTSNSNNGTE